jgi:hypothetical protein
MGLFLQPDPASRELNRALPVLLPLGLVGMCSLCMSHLQWPPHGFRTSATTLCELHNLWKQLPASARARERLLRLRCVASVHVQRICVDLCELSNLMK